MGMSSSQARLLTLTGRMHSIEQKAQRIQAEKLRLANESDRVYDDYLLALDETKLVAKVLNENGTTTDIPFTANLVYTYNGLMGQYALKSKDGKALIPESISNNYRNTNTLSAFLQAQGIGSTTFNDPNPEYVSQQNKWQRDHDAWDEWKADHDAWLREKTQWEIDHVNWENSDPNIEVNKIDTSNPWWETSSYNLGTYFGEAARSTDQTDPNRNCYFIATVNSSPNCYLDILAMILDYDGVNFNKDYNYRTTLGDTTTVNDGIDGYCTRNNILSSGKTSNETLAEVSDVLNSGMKPSTTGKTCDVTSSSTEYQKLVSMWNVDGTVKTMKQWAIDLNYIAQQADHSTTYNITGYPGNSVFCKTIETFQLTLEDTLEHIFNQTTFDESCTEWRANEPTLRPEPTWNGSTNPAEPDVNDYIAGIAATVEREQLSGGGGAGNLDKQLAQYYINLWYKMEGSDEPQQIFETVTHDASGNPIVSYSFHNQNKSTTTFETNDKTGALENENYIIIPTDKLEDPTWLKNSILNGYVIIQQFDELDSKFFDTSVSVTTKIHEVPDETNLKKAEAEYEANMKRINAKDTQYDRDLAVCDNERNAIKSEMETLKTVIKDNVDMNFKLFS